MSEWTLGPPSSSFPPFPPSVSSRLQSLLLLLVAAANAVFLCLHLNRVFLFPIYLPPSPTTTTWPNLDSFRHDLINDSNTIISDQTRPGLTYSDLTIPDRWFGRHSTFCPARRRRRFSLSLWHGRPWRCPLPAVSSPLDQKHLQPFY